MDALQGCVERRRGWRAGAKGEGATDPRAACWHRGGGGVRALAAREAYIIQTAVHMQTARHMQTVMHIQTRRRR